MKKLSVFLAIVLLSCRSTTKQPASNPEDSVQIYLSRIKPVPVQTSEMDLDKALIDLKEVLHSGDPDQIANSTGFPLYPFNLIANDPVNDGVGRTKNLDRSRFLHHFAFWKKTLGLVLLEHGLDSLDITAFKRAKNYVSVIGTQGAGCREQWNFRLADSLIDISYTNTTPLEWQYGDVYDTDSLSLVHKKQMQRERETLGCAMPVFWSLRFVNGRLTISDVDFHLDF